MKIKSDNEMDDIETVLYASPKRENTIDDIETIPYVSPKRENGIDDREAITYASPRKESEDETDEKIYKEPKLVIAVEIEKQTAKREKNLSKVNWNKTRLIFKFLENLILIKSKTFLTRPKKKNH